MHIAGFFANVGLDFDDASSRALFDAVVTMVNQLPEQWLNWLRSNLQQRCSGAEIAAGSNLHSVEKRKAFA